MSRSYGVSYKAGSGLLAFKNRFSEDDAYYTLNAKDILNPFVFVYVSIYVCMYLYVNMHLWMCIYISVCIMYFLYMYMGGRAPGLSPADDLLMAV